jgi:hypothetical protein
VQHVVVSLPSAVPPRDTDSATEQRNFIYWILKFVGIDGGVLVFHHKRITKQGKHPGSQNIHYHTVGHGWVDPELVVGLYEQYGIMVKGLGRTIDREEQLSYILSHAGIPSVTVTNPAIVKSTSAIHWFGTWSYNQPGIEKMPETIFCPGCQADFKKLDWMRIFFIGSDPPEELTWGELAGYQWRAVNVEYVM